MATINESYAIDVLSTDKNKAIERVCNDGNKINNVSTIDTNSTRFVKAKLTKFKSLVQLKKLRMSSFTPGARIVFMKIRQKFIQALILYYFDPKYYVWIEINLSDYIINRVQNQLTTNNLSQ